MGKKKADSRAATVVRPGGSSSSTVPRWASVFGAVVVCYCAVLASRYWSSRTDHGGFSPEGDFGDAARRLAALINTGTPVAVREHMSETELEAALGELQPTALGWSKRVGSFIELLDFDTEHLRVEEGDPTLTERSFDGPVLLRRANGGLAEVATPHLHASKLSKSDTLVRPSRCTMLPMGYGAPPKSEDGNWNPDLQPFSPCPNCSLPLKRFLEFTMDPERPMRLQTAAQDDINIQLQTHGVGGEQLPWLAALLREPQRIYNPPEVAAYIGPHCINPARMGVAGSLRGLPFHSHAAGHNEAVVGRKLFALYPPRELVAGVSMKCPWMPWESADPSSAINEALASFFSDKDDAANPGKGNLTLRACTDLRTTAIQWLVQEFPKLPLDLRPLLILMVPGEVLWIPDGWQHFTVNLDDAFYIYKPSCQNQAQSSVTADQARTVVKQICKRSNRFCAKAKYCHSFCKSCHPKKGGVNCGL